jgi:hypothetical protein
LLVSLSFLELNEIGCRENKFSMDQQMARLSIEREISE